MQQTQGRVTIPSRYETQISNNQDNINYQNERNINPNNNDAFENFDEYQPEVFNSSNEQNYQEKQKLIKQEEPKDDHLLKMNQDISQISLPNVNSNITVYKNIEEKQHSAKLVKKEFVFKYNSDKNGFFYFLGTAGGRRKYVNPFELGEIKVFFSSLAQGDYSNFVGRALTNCRTCNEENAFMGVDLGKDR